MVFDGVDVLHFFRAQSEESIFLVYLYRFYGVVEEAQRFRIVEIPMVFLEILQIVFRCFPAPQADIKPYLLSRLQEVV